MCTALGAVDEAMREAWGPIFECNGCVEDVAPRFAVEHGKYCPKQPEWGCPPITAQGLARTFRVSPATASGAD
eukprot:7105960-Alexandrium_andersonii.AAC.1